MMSCYLRSKSTARDVDMDDCEACLVKITTRLSADLQFGLKLGNQSPSIPSTWIALRTPPCLSSELHVDLPTCQQNHVGPCSITCPVPSPPGYIRSRIRLSSSVLKQASLSRLYGDTHLPAVLDWRSLSHLLSSLTFVGELGTLGTNRWSDLGFILVRLPNQTDEAQLLDSIVASLMSSSVINRMNRSESYLDQSETYFSQCIGRERDTQILTQTPTCGNDEQTEKGSQR